MYGDTCVVLGVYFEFGIGNDYCVWIENVERGTRAHIYYYC